MSAQDVRGSNKNSKRKKKIWVKKLQIVRICECESRNSFIHLMRASECNEWQQHPQAIPVCASGNCFLLQIILIENFVKRHTKNNCLINSQINWFCVNICCYSYCTLANNNFKSQLWTLWVWKCTHFPHFPFIEVENLNYCNLWALRIYWCCDRRLQLVHNSSFWRMITLQLNMFNFNCKLSCLIRNLHTKSIR